MRVLQALLILALAQPMAWGAPSKADGEEIEHLISYLAASDCTFNRNGTWYSGQRAAEHLRTKYDYLLKKGLVTTAETFIERAGSASSMSGKPYLVRCGDAAPVESRAWFLAELARFRNDRHRSAGTPLRPGPGGRVPSRAHLVAGR